MPSANSRPAQSEKVCESKPVSPRIPVWCWRDAIAKACVPPLTKLVCYEISRHLSDAGKSWRIPVKGIIINTSLGNKAVAKHLAIAKAAGLLAIIREVGPHGQRGVTRYAPRFPDNMEFAREPAEPADAPSVDPTRGSLSISGTSRPSVRETLKTVSHVSIEHADQVSAEHDKSPLHKQEPISKQGETFNQQETVHQGESARARSPASGPSLFCSQEEPGLTNTSGVPAVGESALQCGLSGEVRRPKAEAGLAAGKPKAGKPRKTTFQEGAVLSEEGLAYALGKGLSEDQADDEWEGFTLYHKAKGSVFVDWDAAWQNWVRKAQNFSRERASRSGPPRSSGNGAIFEGTAAYLASLHATK